jgi:hypothetical protein
VSFRPALIPQCAFGKRDPLGLRAPDIFGRPLELGQDLRKDRLRLGVAARLGEQQAVAHARLGAGVIVRHGLILGERVLGAAAFFERAGIEQVPFRRLVVRPALAQIVERRHRLLRIAETELGARLAQRVDRVITHRQRQDVFVVPQRLFEFSQRQALLGERGAVSDGIGDTWS